MFLKDDPGSVILIVVKPGSGKSALGYFLLEKLRYRANCYVVNLPKTAHRHLPSWLGVVTSLEDAPFGAVLLVDEAALHFSARMSQSQKNQRLLEVISLARQREQIIIFIAQEASYVDINILRGLSTLIIKESSPLQVFLERGELKEFIRKAEEEFKKIDDDNKRNWAYIAFSPCGYKGMARGTKPDFFTDELSRCYAFPQQETQEKETKRLSKEEKKEKAYKWYTGDHLLVRQIARRLGISKSTVWNWVQEEKKRRRMVIDRLLFKLGLNLDT